jgi:hypothetical protein
VVETLGLGEPGAVQTVAAAAAGAAHASASPAPSPSARLRLTGQLDGDSVITHR